MIKRLGSNGAASPARPTRRLLLALVGLAIVLSLLAAGQHLVSGISEANARKAAGAVGDDFGQYWDAAFNVAHGGSPYFWRGLRADGFTMRYSPLAGRAAGLKGGGSVRSDSGCGASCGAMSATRGSKNWAAWTG